MEITELLNRARGGDAAAAESVIAILYDELRAIARAQMGGAAHTLQPTALVHEAYLRLVRREDSWENRRHFLGFAARAMRSVLVDHARAKQRVKRGGKLERDPLHAAVAWFEENRIDLLALEDALRRLEGEDPRQHRIVELRFFAGLSNAEAAEALSISLATVEREWAVARAWLYRYMADG